MGQDQKQTQNPQDNAGGNAGPGGQYRNAETGRYSATRQTHDWRALQKAWLDFPLDKTLKEFCKAYRVPYATAAKRLKAQDRLRAAVLRSGLSLEARMDALLDCLFSVLFERPMTAHVAASLLPKMLAYKERQIDKIIQERTEKMLIDLAETCRDMLRGLIRRHLADESEIERLAEAMEAAFVKFEGKHKVFVLTQENTGKNSGEQKSHASD